MKGAALSSTFRIEDTRAAEALADPMRRRLILLAAGRDRTLSELSAALDRDLKQLHYHVGVLRKLGLIVVAGTRPRGGRAIKLYRAKAKAFFVPEHVMSSTPGEALAKELRSALAAAHVSSRDGILYCLGENGEPQMQRIQSTAARNAASGEQWRVLALSRVDAQRLAKEVDNCIRSHVSRDAQGAKPYLVHFALAPRLLPGTRRLKQAKR